MAVVRTPVLLPGFYWFVDVETPNRATSFTAWATGQRGLVVVRKTTSHRDARPPNTWVLFEVKFPALWDQRLGFPNTATATDTEESTAGVPDLSTGPGLPTFGDPGSLFSGGTGVLLLAGLLYALSRD